MSAYYHTHLNPLLPWEKQEEESSRYRKILIVILLLCLVFGIVIPLIDVPKDVRVVNKVPDRLVKLVLEQKKVKVPPPPPELPKEEKKEEEKKEEPKPEEKKEEPKPKPKPDPKPDRKEAKKVAEEKAAVFDVFADLRDNTTVAELTESSELTKSGSEAVETRREIIGDSAMKDSGGINVSVASSSKGGGGTLKGSGTTAVTSKIQGVERRQSTSSSSSGKGGQRTSENIQLTFDRNQGKIFTAYNRALRKNPSLQGRVVFKLRIEPNGKVTSVSIVSSQLNDPKLEKRLMSAIKRLDFGAMQVSVWEDTYSIVFTPQ